MSGQTNPTDFYKTLTRSLITPNSLKKRSLVTAIKLNEG
jgi:ornithine decarboxylase